ncbi:MAG TPA: TetR/AcrR family transcriptional regulator [Acidimicrobiales bacterium]|nr:TetR/AcrR family transcriptional regulator [Acidimicrobiales bacterium]
MSDLVPATRDRILEGALLALGRVGMRRLTMSDVSERSGLSRGTVYRYFPSKEDLLAVLAEYERDRFSEGLRRTLEGIPEEDQSLDLVVEYIINYLRQHPALTLLIDTEPAFVLGFLSQQLPVFRRITEELIDPVMRNTVPVREGWVTIAELNELLLRVVLSVFLVPGESRASVVGALEGTLGSMVRLAAGRELPKQARRSTTGRSTAGRSSSGPKKAGRSTRTKR